MTPAAAPIQRAVRFGSADIAYALTYRPRRDLAITVHPDLNVTVVAPEGRAAGEIDAKVLSRGAWIVRQRLRFRDLHPLPTPHRFVSGETHRYLGRQYRLRVLQGPAEGVRLERPFVYVTTRDRSHHQRVGQLLGHWIRARAQAVFLRQLDRILESHPSLGSSSGHIRIRHMSRRWGSCTPGGTITLHPELVRAPPSCIEYVLIHELCHRRVMNHGPRFLRLLAQTLPDWPRRRDQLNRLSAH